MSNSLPFSDDDLIEPVSNILESEIKPLVQKDRGDIHLAKIQDGVVYVKFDGACVGCKAKDTTLNKLVAQKLQIAIHPDIKVVAVN